MGLLGLHGLTQHFTAQLLGVSEATMSSWMNGKSTPSLAKAIDIAELFQITTDRLIGAEFADLPANELADPERFENVETRIKRSIEVEVCVRADDLDGNWQDWLPELDESESSA